MAVNPENGVQHQNRGSRKGGNMGIPIFLMTDLRTAAWKQSLKDAIEAEGFGVRRPELMEEEFLKVGDPCPPNY